VRRLALRASTGSKLYFFAALIILDKFPDGLVVAGLPDHFLRSSELRALF
jgi:hypothetical protein